MHSTTHGGALSTLQKHEPLAQVGGAAGRLAQSGISQYRGLTAQLKVISPGLSFESDIVKDPAQAPDFDDITFKNSTMEISLSISAATPVST